MINKINNYCFYISYDGLLDPLGNSQILPYLEGLSDEGFKFVVLSFEKTDRKEKLIDELNNRISQISDNKIKRRGYNKLYMDEVTQANEGVDFKFLK